MCLVNVSVQMGEAHTDGLNAPLTMKKRFSEEQIIGFLKEAEAGLPVKELCRKHGFSDASFYTWRAKFVGMEVSEAKRLKDLESENARRKKLLAEAMRDREALKVVVKGKY